MAKLIIYLLESSAVLAFFYLVYLLVLQQETFFSLNRFFLLGILLFSLAFPFLRFDFTPREVSTIQRPVEEISKLRTAYFEAMAQWEFNQLQQANAEARTETHYGSINWMKLLFTVLAIVYGAGVILCLSRTLWTLRWIRKMIATLPQKKMEGITVIMHPDPIAPFSFFGYVFVHSALVTTPEFDQILAHERTHIRQRHSIDLILAQLLAAFFWFNPVIWRLIKSLKTTHEYIADKNTISLGYSLVAYQTLLLKQLISNNSHGLIHNFNLSFIKKRITMMKHTQSGWQGKVKVAAAVICTTVVSLILLQCNARLEDAENPTARNGNNITLPLLPQNSYAFRGDLSNVVKLTIAKDNLTVNGEPIPLEELAEILEKGEYNNNVAIHLSIDKDQSMGFVRAVEMELRKADRRKILYVGQTNTGATVEMPLVLPPSPEDAARMGLVIPDIAEAEAAGTTDILKIRTGDRTESVTRQAVYDFVQRHIHKQSSDYVVSFVYEDDDIYNDYLRNMASIKEAFNTIYQERALKMFGKDYASLDKEENAAVRSGVPTAISVAEKSL